MILFGFVYFGQLFVIEPKLDVWYFMLSTTLIGVKLLASFIFAANSNPGFVTKESSSASLTPLTSDQLEP
jgi:hypothetical protein